MQGKGDMVEATFWWPCELVHGKKLISEEVHNTVAQEKPMDATACHVL